jgi:tetratricopeptide (TPR) repeat protein
MKPKLTLPALLPVPAFALAFALAFAPAGCGSAAFIQDPQRPALFGEEVDSVVVEPFRVAPNTKTGINEVDQGLFQELLSEEIRKRPFLRVFPEAPTELPNTIVLEGRLETFEVQDLPGKEVFLRVIHLGVELRVRRGGGTDEPQAIRRELSYQKVYVPSETIPVMSFDLRSAVTEIAEQLAEAMYPTAVSGDLPLATGSDPAAGLELGHPLLLRGNGYAADHRYDRARKLWRYLLFDPSFPEEREPGAPKLFRISPRTLKLLREGDMEEDVVKELEPLTRLEPEELVDFRELLRGALGGFVPEESELLTVADHRRDRVHLNLAAAHRNLALLDWLDGRYDRAVYHLARAYANYPEQEYLAKWLRIQKARKLLPKGYTNEEAITLHLRLPPPRGMALQPGSAEDALFAPVVFEQAPPPPGTEGAAPGKEKEQGGAEQRPVELRPVELPPASGLPPIEAAERAKRR